jgi:hypothetical protein
MEILLLAKNYLVKNSTKDKHRCKTDCINLVSTTFPCEFFEN